ncbi:MAG: class I SAM-dependent methyltransferase, partial [Thiovulaceae bacterium]|nr:class I SAM-dependent methyltransferase [Sulfurimonadaceae bacterium]
LGLQDLGDAIKESRPAGLQHYFNKEWETIYPHLSQLPPKAKESWFGFDHFYSDSAFQTLVDIMTKRAPKKLLDVGGNTGKWALALTKASPETEVTILDHPGQIEVAFKNAEEAGLKERVHGIPMDLLDHSIDFPKGFDVVWMSQFLDCFPPEDIIALLKRAKEALNANGRIHIIEPYWDRQQHEIGAYILINTSPYFTALANGTSKMYSAKEMQAYLEAAGLEIDEEIDRLGFGHTMTVCKQKS